MHSHCLLSVWFLSKVVFSLLYDDKAKTIWLQSAGSKCKIKWGLVKSIKVSAPWGGTWLWRDWLQTQSSAHGGWEEPVSAGYGACWQVAEDAEGEAWPEGVSPFQKLLYNHLISWQQVDFQLILINLTACPTPAIYFQPPAIYLIQVPASPCFCSSCWSRWSSAPATSTSSASPSGPTITLPTLVRPVVVCSLSLNNWWLYVCRPWHSNQYQRRSSCPESKHPREGSRKTWGNESAQLNHFSSKRAVDQPLPCGFRGSGFGAEKLAPKTALLKQGSSCHQW